MVNKTVFVFGSNLAGRHGRGSALEALRRHGAVYGQGIGLQGESYAIPTKDKNLRVLPLSEIQKYVDDFKKFARENLTFRFRVVKIGCGLAGYREEQIFPMFADCPENVDLPKGWRINHVRPQENRGIEEFFEESE